ncbi:MAG: PDZ domain-containing protein [Pirellulaceae bacterium]
MKSNWLNRLLLVTLISAASCGFAQEKTEEKKTDKEGKQTETTTMQLDGGKLIVVDKDGKKSEIDVGNAKSVIIQKEKKSKVVDGKQVENHGMAKATIMGPDGEVREIELAIPGEGFSFELAEGLQLPGHMDLKLGHLDHAGHLSHLGHLAGGKYFIGIQCEPISESLRSHLNIDGKKGLLVENVTADSPAASAGIKVNDILLFAGDKELTSIEDVMKVVNDAGEAKQVVEFGIIRNGKETSVQVTPAERKEGQVVLGMDLEGDAKSEWEALKQAPLRLMPGVIRAQDHEAFQKAIEEFRAEMFKLGNNSGFGEAAKAEMERARKDLEKAREELDKAREEMMRAIDEMKKRKSSGGDDRSPNPAT